METTETQVFGLRPGETLLDVNAHPDDQEMFHSSGIKAAQEQGINVVMAIATRGEATTLNYDKSNWPKNTPIEVIRRHETEQSLDAQGIPRGNREYFNLPDGRLHRPLQRLRLAWRIARTILKYNVTAVLTPGSKGIDKHEDHLAVHRSTLWAVRALRLLRGKRVAVWASTRGDLYNCAVDVDAEQKRKLVHIHVSQFPKNKPELFDEYKDLLEQERYVRIR